MPSQSEKLMRARCRLMTREPWYGHCAMSMTWIPSDMPWLPEQRRTMGVRVVNGGEIQCIYYPPFVDSMTLRELFAVIQHEIEHIVRLHCLRISNRNPEAWNVACDMTVNGTKNKPRIGYAEPSTNEIIVPLKGEIVWIPDGWPTDETAEHYYDKLEKLVVHTCPNCGRAAAQGKGKDKDKGKGGKGKSDQGDQGAGQGQGKGQGQNQGQGGQGGQSGQSGQDQGDGSHACPTCGQGDDGDYRFGGIGGRAIDDHSTWNQSDVSADEARQVIKDMVDQATEKCQGHAPGHLEEAIKNLAKPIVKWRNLLRHYIGRHLGSRRLTYSRRNRRRDIFGLPGISHHAATTVTVIVDTSGSIGSKELSQFFSEIDDLSNRVKVNLLQWDHAFQDYCVYRRGDWKKLKVKGRGGTDMAAPVEWLVKNRLVPDVTIMLTDGYCNYAEEKKFPMITVITSPDTKGPGWGHEVRLKIGW